MTARALVLMLAVVPAMAGDLRILRDVVYSRGPGKEVRLDAYLCQSAHPVPVLVYIHGGGWSQGSKAAVPAFLRPQMLDAGVTLVSIDYRLSGEAVWPSQGDDVARAIQFLRSKAGEWNLDKQRIAVMGTSAGAHLALWVGLHDDRANPGAQDPVERESTRVRAIVNFYGPADFALVRRLPDKHTHSAYRTLFGYSPGQPVTVLTPAQIKSASPVTYASADDPPVFTVHGTGDTTVPVEQAESLIATLRNAGVETVNFLLQGGNHGLSNPLPTWPGYQKAAIEFLKRHLGR